MPDLLLELLSEEMPAGLQEMAANQLSDNIISALEELEINHSDTRIFSTPRRISIVVNGLPTLQSDRKIERKGPRADAPMKAINGFLVANGVSLDECELREDKKGAFYVAVIEIRGLHLKNILADLIEVAIGKVSWTRSMRWADSRFRWVRPLRNILAVFDERPIAGKLDLEGGSLEFNDHTYGHRFLAPGIIKVKNEDDYLKQLEKSFVLINREDRKTFIADSLKKKAEKFGLSVKQDNSLIDEVAGLVEWPEVLIGNIDEQFMGLPMEVLIASMRTHQKYFALELPNGKLASKFAFVSNISVQDGGKDIITGNQRVLRARLSDAQHFWDQDRKKSLDDLVPSLDKVVFHAKLGSLGSKVNRITKLSIHIAKEIPEANEEIIGRASRLAKADLVTGMVGEFPELQGTIGKYYSLSDDESSEVATAIAEHYSPLGPGDKCPRETTSITVSLADKIDTLVGFWAINEKPTGSKDPYALRRAALGIIRLVLENKLRFSLQFLFSISSDLYEIKTDGVPDDLMVFMADRLKVHLREEGVLHSHIEAIFSLSAEDDLLRLLERVKALSAFLKSEDGANLLVAYRRAANIVRQEEKKDKKDFSGESYDPNLSVDAEGKLEAELWRAMVATKSKVTELVKKEKFVEAMASLALLRKPVDNFFENVKVNVEDLEIRNNRLCLCTQIQQVMDNVADFSKIEG